MSKLPTVSGRDVVKVLTKKHFEIENKRGSHLTLVNRKDYRKPLRLIVPDHRELCAGTLSHIIADSRIDRAEFLKAISN